VHCQYVIISQNDGSNFEAEPGKSLDTSMVQADPDEAAILGLSQMFLKSGIEQLEL